MLIRLRFGYIDFADQESATEAVNALHQQLFEGRRLVCQYASNTSAEIYAKRAAMRPDQMGSQRPKNPPSKTLFIGNMSFEMTDRDLNNLFRGVRNVVDVRVAIDRRTGQPRGFAHADFIDVKSAQEAATMLVGKEAYGRRLRIDFAFGNSMAPKNQPDPPPTQE
jgi:nucleolin